MRDKEKLRWPKDVFGEELQVGEKIVYLVPQHGYTVLNWAEILEINPRKNHHHLDHPVYTTKVNRYAMLDSWHDKQGEQVVVYLTNPTVLKVGKSIKDYVL